MTKGERQLDGIKVLLGVSGSVAAYKAVELASKLTASGAAVKTVMTQNACRLVAAKSFEAVTGSAVYTSLWDGAEPYCIGHTALVDWADIVVVAPATANIIGKMANGICDDLLSTTLCVCWARPVLMAPAMNNNMWENPAVRRNVERLKGMSLDVIGPQVGRLACGDEAIGRMAEPADIVEAVGRIASGIKHNRE
jgi:phosphopantothenoylcysteine synthetase/decarboxylase